MGLQLFEVWHTSPRLPLNNQQGIRSMAFPSSASDHAVVLDPEGGQWMKTKEEGDGKGPCDRAVEQSKLQTYAKIKRQVSSMITLWLYILYMNLLAIDGNWIVDSQVEEIPSLLGVQHSMFRCWGNLSTKHLGLTMPHWRGLSLHGPSYAWQFAANAWLLDWHHKPHILGPHKSASCVGGRLKMPCMWYLNAWSAWGLTWHMLRCGSGHISHSCKVYWDHDLQGPEKSQKIEILRVVHQFSISSFKPPRYK